MGNSVVVVVGRGVVVGRAMPVGHEKFMATAVLLTFQW